MCGLMTSLPTIRENTKEIIREREIETRVKETINDLSERYNVPRFDIYTRYRLLLPLAYIYPFNDMSVDCFCNLIKNRLYSDIPEFSEELHNWNIECGALGLCGCSPIYRNSGDSFFVYASPGEKINLTIKDVDETTGLYLETKIHYLHSFRKDAAFRKGLFVVGHSMPVLYTSLIEVCSPNKTRLVCEALKEKRSANIYEISRTIGCSYLPYNSISIMNAFLRRGLRTHRANYLITAVNSFLGFDGSSIRASGFEYLVERYVDYSYTTELSYVGPLDKDPNKKYYTDKSSLTNQIYCSKL